MCVGAKLLLHSSDDAWMAMAYVKHRDASGKIDVAFALNIPNLGIFSTRCENWRCSCHATWHGIGPTVEEGFVFHGAILSAGNKAAPYCPDDASGRRLAQRRW
jgi:hypothetical protein